MEAPSGGPASLQGRERAADHGRTELVLAIRRPAVDGAGDEEVVLRPIGEDRPEAERFALVEPIGAAKLLSIETAEAKAEAARLIGGDFLKRQACLVRDERGHLVELLCGDDALLEERANP